MSQAQWLPLESNPDVINKYLKKLGISSNVQCADVIGFDPELLAMIPNKTVAMLLLFPASTKYEALAKEQNDKLVGENYKAEANVYFIKQNISNACGTIAMIHALANNESAVNFGDGCWKRFYEKSKNASPEEKAKMLEEDSDMMRAHESCAEEGDTAAPPRDARVDYHFIALVNKNNALYELDGRKTFPIKHGVTSDESFLADAAKVCQEFMSIEPESFNFTGLALTVG
jgi:ubiquitin carboxyl-terminal hydrolase L3